MTSAREAEPGGSLSEAQAAGLDRVDLRDSYRLLLRCAGPVGRRDRRSREEVPEARYTIPLGQARIRRAEDDVTVVTWGAMTWTAAEAAVTLEAERISVEISDLRWLAAPDTPVPFSPPLEKAFIPQADDVVRALQGLAAY